VTDAHMSDIEHNKELRKSINQNLDQFTRNESADTNLTQASVVIGVSTCAQSNTANILLTQRSYKLRKHAGQFALPGGKVDSGESIICAALRELEEELNIQQHPDSVLGLLDDMPTQSGFNIIPVVVWIDDISQLKPNAGEVAEVYEIPLTELRNIDLDISFENDSDTSTRGGYSQQRTSSADEEIMSLYLPSVGTTIYSPTAAIVYQFREVALLGNSTRVAHFGQPRFAWR